MKLILKRIRWQNFLSTGNQWTEIDLLANKTTLIVGKNGSGKSTLLDALSFVLFNRPFRNINKPQLVNSITNKDCLVECEFEINGYQFMVRRGIKPNIFEIYRNGEMIMEEDAANRDYQRAFEKHVLRINHQTFCQIVILGSAIFTPFLALKTPQRREVIENISNLTIFSDMNKILHNKIYDDDRVLEKKDHEKRIRENEVKLTEAHIEQLKNTHDSAIEAKNEQIRLWKIELNKLLADEQKLSFDINRLEDEIDEKHDPLRQKHTKLNKLNTELKHKIQLVNKDILFLLNNETCPTCKQIIQPEFKDDAIRHKRDHIAEVENALTKLDESIEKINVQLDEVRKLEDDLGEVERMRHEFEMTAKHHNMNILETQKEIDQIQEASREIDWDKLADIKGELNNILEVLNDMRDNRAVMEYAIVLLKDSGIKAKIIKTFMPIINQLIAKYLAALDFFVEFTLDEQFDAKIKSRYRDEFSYDSFSEGEKMRLNLAVLFTWRAIARQRSSMNVNLIIFDEVLDSSLDNSGISDILNLITNMVEDNIIIISHREDQMTDKFGKVLKFEKNKNFSKVVE